ncbi:MAG: hypothetical protein Q8835_02585, partial [Sweet potato little leaf phytoplasma]|nr:hypothetical protein [Sweet potato little leaf phytoplasma]
KKKKEKPYRSSKETLSASRFFVPSGKTKTDSSPTFLVPSSKPHHSSFSILLLQLILLQSSSRNQNPQPDSQTP